MPRIVGVDIPKEKRIDIALTAIHGIGLASASQILKDTGIAPDVRAKNLTEEEVARISNLLQKSYKYEGALRREVGMNIKRLMDIGSWRGLRHKKGLPVRGQRTRTNARTRKGPKKTIGASRKRVETAAPAAPAPAAPGKG